MDTAHRSVKNPRCLSKKTDKEYRLLHELMLPEEFERCIGNDIRTLKTSKSQKIRHSRTFVRWTTSH